MKYDLIVIGAGACGIIGAIVSARAGKKVLLLEKLPTIASKLKATGGGRCNLTNRLPNDEFISHFGRDGRFIRDAINIFDHKKLIDFLQDIGIQTDAPDGFRVFPASHKSTTVIASLKDELDRLKVDILCNQKVTQLISEDTHITAVKTTNNIFYSKKVILATGGNGYPALGTEGDGYRLSQSLGHSITPLYPAMMPLKIKESWVDMCRADTIAKVEIKVAIKKYKKLKAKGDLIFTKNGIRGPVVLDFAREITPILDKLDEVPISLNLTKGMNEEQILQHIKNSSSTIMTTVSQIVAKSVAREILKLSNIKENETYKQLSGISKATLISLLASTPLTIIGHDGFKMAMITRGGISLKEINPKTMQSKIIKGLFFCGEVIDIDGPCGGYNLQWAFSSGFLAGKNSSSLQEVFL